MSAGEVERQLDRVARGGALGLIGAVVAGSAGFGMVVTVARGYAPAEAGLFFSATAVFLVLEAVATLGTESGFARFLMRYEAQGRSLSVRRAVEAGALPAFGMALLLAGLGGAFARHVANALGLGATGADLLVVLFMALPFAVCADLALSVLRAFSRIRSTVVVDRILRTSLQLVAAMVVVATDGSLTLLMVCWAGTYVVSAALAVPLAFTFLARRHSVRAVHSPMDHSGEHPHEHPVAHEFWAFTAYRGVASVAQIAIQKADIVIVAAVISPSAAALYTVATRFVAIGQMVTQALQQVMQPRFTAILLRKDRALLHDVHRTVTAWNILTVWPVYATVAAAPAAYLAIFGSGYTADDTWQVVTVMGVAMLFAVATGPIDTLLLMSGRSRISLANAVSALAVDIALCLTLLPVMGVVGAAIAWACAVGLRCSLAVLQVRADLGVPFGGTEPALAATAAIGCFAVPSLAWTALGADRLWVWAVLFLLGATAYAALLWRLRRVLRLDVLVSAVFRSGGAMRGGRRVSSALRKRLPAPVVDALRSAATAWGMLTARFRMEPSFLVAGAQRSGTTTLFRLLADHPNLVRPTLDKGTGYFDDNHHRGRRWYRAHFPLRALARWRARGPVQTFECSGYYMFHPLAPSRIAAELPNARVVVMLRNPVDRAVSAYGHERRRGFESAGFVDALAREQERLANEVDRLTRDEHYRSFAHRHHAYLRRGEYAGQVAALIEAVGRDRVYVMDADAFFADPESEFVALQRWLGLPIQVPENVEKWNAGSPEPMPAQWRARLEEYFAPHDRQLADLIGRTPHWRSTPTEAK